MFPDWRNMALSTVSYTRVSLENNYMGEDVQKYYMFLAWEESKQISLARGM